MKAVVIHLRCWVAQLGARKIANLCACATLRDACCALIIAAACAGIVKADQVPALRTDWQYYAYDGSNYDICATSDTDAADQTIAHLNTSCPVGNFDSWTTSWPNTVGVTGYRQFCPPVGVPYVWGFEHLEARNFQWDFKTPGSSCTTTTTSTSHVERQFFYYCPPSYTIGEVSTSPVAIPACWRNSTSVSPPKQPNSSCTSAGPCTAGNPINLVTGIKFQQERDYASADPFPLLWDRYYVGGPWMTAYSRHLLVTVMAVPSGSHTLPYLILQVVRDDGRTFSYDNDSGTGSTWKGDADVVLKVATQFDGSGNVIGHSVTDENDSVESYNGQGQLLSIKNRAGVTQTVSYDVSGRLSAVTNPFGRSIALAYNAAGQIATMTDPNGGLYQYGYDSLGNLTSVTDPTLNVRTYVYNEPVNTSGANLPSALTGIVDESSLRFATYQYDATGRAITTQHAGGADLNQITYNADGTVTVTDPLSAVRTYTFRNILYVGHVSTVTGAASRVIRSGCKAESIRTPTLLGTRSAVPILGGSAPCYSASSRPQWWAGPASTMAT